MIDVYPQLSDAKIEYVWGGTLDFAFDIMPHAGQMDGMYYAVGYAGHGVAMATYQGQKIAELMAGDKPENPFVGIPFPGAPLGLYNGNPWFLPLVGVVQSAGLGELRKERQLSLEANPVILSEAKDLCNSPAVQTLAASS